MKHEGTTSAARKFFSVLLGTVGLWACAAGWAADYPDKPVKFVVTAAPGGSSDLLARKLSQIMQAQTNATFVIENRPGASGSIGLLSMIRSKPDGYTIAIANPDAVAVFPSLKSPAPYTYEQDLKAVAQAVDLNYVFTVNANSPINSFTDLVKFAKAQPQPITYGSAGLDTSTNLVAEIFADQSGIKIQSVPYSGGGTPSLMSVASGDTTFSIASLLTMKALLDGKRIKPIGILREARLPSLPNMSTAAENGLNMNFTSYSGVFVPKDTPADVVKRLGEMVTAAANTPEFQEFARSQLIDVKIRGPQEFDEHIRKDLVGWRQAIARRTAQAGK